MSNALTMRLASFLTFLTPVTLLTVTVVSPAHAADAVDFNRDVRPILSNNCFKCHGPDEKARKSKLRLDERDGAVAPAKSGERAIVPGKPNQSELVKRIFSTDPDEVMPPPSTKKSLTDAQKQILKKWISAGAKYDPHWAFAPPKKLPPPATKQKIWPRNPIDQFVLARLEKEKLSPSPEADRYMLARRVHLDLIGLPPTPEEADAFVSDKSPDAYEKLVDKLLASPQYGERWARRWLDLARYADTNGYEKDRPRIIWPYRDWVIKAINNDMSFDQFTIRQQAGDLLPNATPDDRIATGFHRNTMLNEEGGIDPLEFRFYSTVDRINTTGTAWLGLTVGCAQCHTHKFDPILHREYYQMMAFLNNADEPTYEIPDANVEKQRADIEQRISQLYKTLPDKFPLSDVQWEIVGSPPAVTSGVPVEKLADGSWSFSGDAPDKDTYTFVVDSKLAQVDRIRIETIREGNVGPGRTPHGNFVLSEITATVASLETPEQSQAVKIASARADVSQDNYSVAHAIDGNVATGWAIAKGDIQSRTATFFLEKPVTLPQGARWTIRFDQQFGGKHVLGRFRLSLGGPVDDPRPMEVRRKEVLDRSFTAWEKTLSANAVRWEVLRPIEAKSNSPFLTMLDDNSVLASGDITKSDTYHLTFRGGGGITAIRLEVLPHESLPQRGPGLVAYEGPIGDFFLSEISLLADGKPQKFVRAIQSFAGGNAAASRAIDGDQQSGWSIDGGQGKAHVAIFGLADPTAQNVTALQLKMLFERYYAASLGRFRISVTTDLRGAQAAPLPPEVAEALAVAPDQRKNDQQARILRHFLETAPELADGRKEIDRLRSSMPRPQTTLVMRERPPQHPRATNRHHRGEFTQREEIVEPILPSFLKPKSAPRDRLGFAQWLVSRENPLTARVVVNRQWQAFFGRGLVRTLEDFGYQGEPPSHPELLDWLAVEFMDRGWSMKQLHRLIVTSATYRQSSRVTPKLLSSDPQNILLARGPRGRLEAELVRDAALKISGLLSAKLGGPSVFPPQPASVTTEGAYGALQWKASTGEDRYRRSLYTYSKRTTPFALYGTFDAPSGEACLARREVSNTPLQALSLLNDTIFVEAAQALGAAVAASAGTDEGRATSLFRRCLTRPPRADELVMLVDFYRKQKERFAQNPASREDAQKISPKGEGDVAERAAWVAVARAVLNLDETINKE